MDADKENAVFSAEAGDIIGPLRERTDTLIKVSEFKNGGAKRCMQSHPRFHRENDSVRVEAGERIFSQRRRRKGFFELGRQYS